MENFSKGSFNGYLKYLDKEKVKYDKLIPCLSIPYGKASDFLSKQLITAIPYLDAHTSLYGVLSRYFDDPDARIAFTFQAKLHRNVTLERSGHLQDHFVHRARRGDLPYHGGLNRLSHGMAEAFMQSGGRIHVSSPVRKVWLKMERQQA